MISSRRVAGEELFPCPHKFNDVEAERCPVRFSLAHESHSRHRRGVCHRPDDGGGGDGTGGANDLSRRGGLVEDPPAYPWSSCAAYARGTRNRLITIHPSYLALSPCPKVRQRHYRSLLQPSPDSQAVARDPRWITQRAVGSPAFLRRFLPPRGRRRIAFVPLQIQSIGLERCPVPFQESR